MVSGRDVIAQAQSGTGKTATFSISILQSIDVTVRETQALVLSPTRELATQIQSVVLALGDYMNVQCHACIGGTSIGEDIRKLEYGQHVVSGTPVFHVVNFTLDALKAAPQEPCAVDKCRHLNSNGPRAGVTLDVNLELCGASRIANEICHIRRLRPLQRLSVGRKNTERYVQPLIREGSSDETADMRERL